MGEDVRGDESVEGRVLKTVAVTEGGRIGQMRGKVDLQAGAFVVVSRGKADAVLDEGNCFVGSSPSRCRKWIVVAMLLLRNSGT